MKYCKQVPRSPARENEHTAVLHSLGCVASRRDANREAEVAAVLQEVQPDICVFDRPASCEGGLFYRG